MNDCFESCSCIRIDFLALKEMAEEAMSNSRALNAFKVVHYSGHAFLKERAAKPLLSACFNLIANNFALVLNRRSVAKRLTMRVVKGMKMVRKRTSSLRIKNDDKHVSSWTYNHCESYFKIRKAIQQCSKAELHDRFVPLKPLISCGLENVVLLLKAELRSMSA